MSKILLIDDDERVVEAITSFLEREIMGYRLL